MSKDVEIPLAGGNTNDCVVRVGDTVRRSVSRQSGTVHELLVWLEQQNFKYSPRFLGIDDKQREILQFIEGDTGIPGYIWTNDVALVSATKILKTLHQLTAEYLTQHQLRDVKSHWGMVYADESKHEVICHNDFAPYNFVFKHERTCAIFDFDLCGPGPRLRDVAYLAYWMVPLSFNAGDMSPYTATEINNGFPRLRLLCDTYGIPLDAALLDMVSEVLAIMWDAESMLDVLGEDVVQKLERDGHLAHWRKESESFDANRSVIERAIF